MKISGKENVPHDLWPATELPPLNFIEKLSLVLAGFNVTFDLSPAGDAVKLVAMPQSATLQRKYTTPGDAQGIAAQLGPKFPAGNFSASGKELTVVGPWEVHDAVARLLAGERVRPSPPPTRGKQVYTLNAENKPVGGVMKALATQLGKKVTFDDVKVQRRLASEISLNVKDASLDELLHAVLDPANLKFELQGDTIRVFD